MAVRHVKEQKEAKKERKHKRVLVNLRDFCSENVKGRRTLCFECLLSSSGGRELLLKVPPEGPACVKVTTQDDLIVTETEDGSDPRGRGRQQLKREDSASVRSC